VTMLSPAPASFGTASALTLAMSVAAGIEIVVGGHPEQGQSRVSANLAAKSQGAGWAGAPGANSSLPSAPGAESFRSSWQSMLASLGTGLQNLSQEDAGAKTVSAAGEPAVAEAAQTASAAFAGRAALPLPQRVLQQGASPASAKMPFLVRSPCVIPAERAASGAPRQTAAIAAAGSLANAQPGESAPLTHSTNPSKSAKLESASGAATTAFASATAGSIPLTVLAPSIESPIAKLVEAPQRDRLADRSAGSPTGFAPDSANTHSFHSDGTRAAADRAGAVGHQAAAGTDPPSGMASPASDAAQLPTVYGASPDENPDGTEVSATYQAESLAGSEEAMSPGRVPPQADEPTRAHAQSQIQAQLGSPGLEAAAAPVASGEAGRRSEAAQPAAFQSGQSPAVLPLAAKPGLASDGRSATQATLRLAHGPGTGESAEHGNRLLNGRSAGPAADASALARDPGGARAAMSTANDSSTGAASGAVSRETFAALDSEAAPGTPTWIHAGAQRAEAGFQDPALGWIGVRGDMGTGGVHASLVPGSADAAQALSGHMAGLNSYLAEHHTPVETLTLAAPEGRWAGSAGDQGASPGMNQGQGKNAGQGAFAEPQSNPSPTPPELTAAASLEAFAQTGSRDLAVPSARPGGLHISVMA
jgi:hypothetical protein